MANTTRAFSASTICLPVRRARGEGKFSGAPDLVSFMGLNARFLHPVGAAEIKSITALRGKQLAVDALTTEFAFVMQGMIARAGLTDTDIPCVRVGGSSARLRTLLDGKQVAMLLNTPFDLQAVDCGFNRLGSTAQMLGSYQGHAAGAQRVVCPGALA